MESMWVGFPQSCWGEGELVFGGLVGWGGGEGGGAYAVDEDAEVRGGLGAEVEVFHFDECCRCSVIGVARLKRQR